MCRITPHSPICVRTNLNRSAVEKTKNSVYSHILHIASTNIHLIANRRMGGDSTPDFACFLYTSLLCTMDIQILNWVASFHGVPRLPEIRLACRFD